jgi:hypothetical protein
MLDWRRGSIAGTYVKAWQAESVVIVIARPTCDVQPSDSQQYFDAMSLNPSVVALHQLERTTAANVGYVAKSSSEVGALRRKIAGLFRRQCGRRTIRQLPLTVDAGLQSSHNSHVASIAISRMRSIIW